jgi:RNA polymerase sigma-70 factor, ECF subfamily
MEPARSEEGPIGRFEAVYTRHVVGIYRYVYARVGNRPDAEDLTGQVFARAVEQLDTTRDDRQVASWLYRVAANGVADYWRAFYRLPTVAQQSLPPGWEPAAEPSAGAEIDPRSGTRRRVEELLSRLPANYRRVLELRFLHRCSVAETAERMGISRGNVKVLQYRALRRAASLVEAADG